VPSSQLGKKSKRKLSPGSHLHAYHNGHALYSLPGGWLIPVAILIVLSFPPVCAVAAWLPYDTYQSLAFWRGNCRKHMRYLVGSRCWLRNCRPWYPTRGDGQLLVSGIGFSVRLSRWRYLSFFRYGCRSRKDKWLRSSLEFGLLAHVIQDGGFLMALLVRYSTIPPHGKHDFLASVLYLTFISRHHCFLLVRHECRNLFGGYCSLTSAAIRNCLPWCSLWGGSRRKYVAYPGVSLTP